MKQRHRQLAIGASIYLLGVILFTWLTYFNTRSRLIENLDERLSATAYVAADMLGDEFHYLDMDPDSVSEEVDLKTSLKLTQLARRADVDYVYSMIEHGDDIIFVTSNATEEELANDSYEPAYFMHYEEASDELRRVFRDLTVGHDEYEDRWGEFRSFFLPLTAADGSHYVVGADISLDKVAAAVWQSTATASLLGIGLALIGLPMFVLYLKSVQREAQLEVQKLYHCELTGLPNRNQLLKDIESTQHASVALIDIDKFREVNALYGPAVGDDVLKQFSVRLANVDSTALKNQYKAYHLNGDEFATLVSGNHSEPVLIEELSRLYDQLTKHPFSVSGQSINLRVRVGASADGEDPFMLADMALREARDTNKSVVVYRDRSQLPETFLRNFKDTQNFRRALDEKRFVPFFQPLLNTSTGKIEKYECLARMVDESGNVIGTPCTFLPVAFRSRLYHRFSQLMLEKVFKLIENNGHTVSMNLSVADIEHPPTVNYLFHKLSNSHLAKHIEFEIMEDQNISDLDAMRRFIAKVRAMGVRVGLDDMGKDYSNVDRLLNLPVDFVKIDGSVILHLASDKEAQDIARMIISYSFRHKIKTVAEYCQDSKVSEVARRLGVDFLQGYHIGIPVKNFESKPQAIPA